MDQLQCCSGSTLSLIFTAKLATCSQNLSLVASSVPFYAGLCLTCLTKDTFSHAKSHSTLIEI